MSLPGVSTQSAAIPASVLAVSQVMERIVLVSSAYDFAISDTIICCSPINGLKYKFLLAPFRGLFP